jgi:hypothetical protein
MYEKKLKDLEKKYKAKVVSKQKKKKDGKSLLEDSDSDADDEVIERKKPSRQKQPTVPIMQNVKEDFVVRWC